MSERADEPRTQLGRWESVDAEAYDDRWTRMAKRGHDPHGEVDFVERFQPRTALDAGCGTGRVAIELARRGIHAVGIDLDGPMISAARAKAPQLTFHHGDLASLDLGVTFDVIVMAGNVMIFVAPGTEALVVERSARHLTPGGRLVAGFQLDRGLTLAAYDDNATAAGLVLEERWATWDGQPFDGGAYAVSVHRLPEGGAQR